jgi:osmoprotectant transport system permease protein
MKSLFDSFVDRWEMLTVAFNQHIVLVSVSMAIAIAISVPLGVILTKYRILAEPVIGASGVAQTIPSLALLGFLLPLVGIGMPNAIIALSIYALLPILRNTYTGILEVDPAVIDAGRGMGMTRMQILMKIQLPLALPVIMAGIRTSAVITVGVATLATFVGAGGLGDIIMRGISTINTNLILVGAIPAGLLAIVIDALLKYAQVLMTPRGLRKK